MAFRFGVNLGEVVLDGERIYGDGVNVAARLQGLAQPGGVCISAAVHEQVENKLAMGFDCAGEHTVKNIAKPVVVYCVRIATLADVDTDTSADAPGPAPGASTPSLPSPPRCSIAVLPFEDLTADSASGPFVSGLTEDLATDLAKLADVTIVAVPEQVSGSSADAIAAQKARQQLAASYLLEGSVRKVEDMVRITAQLVEVTTGHHVWGERYDRLLGDIFAVQDEVVKSIIVGVHAALALGDDAAAR
jgi:adenylate cyclase